MEFYDKPLDLVECGRRHPDKVAVRPFGTPVVALADTVVRVHLPPGELEGVRKCICHL